MRKYARFRFTKSIFLVDKVPQENYTCLGIPLLKLNLQSRLIKSKNFSFVLTDHKIGLEKAPNVSVN
jgi:hypothetical protein